jgi:hypothetical protein
MTDEWWTEKNLKVTIRGPAEVYFLNVCFEEIWKAMKYLSQDSQCPDEKRAGHISNAILYFWSLDQLA